jgi:hypothetical protein
LSLLIVELLFSLPDFIKTLIGFLKKPRAIPPPARL